MALAALLLAAAVGNLAWFLRPNRRRVRHPFARRAMRTFVHFALSSLAALVLLGRLDALVVFPRDFAGVRADLVALAGGVPSPAFLAWSLGGILIGGIAAALLERRGRNWTLGDITAVQPRTRGDLAWGVLLSLEAGVAEEWFFRLLAPLLVALATGSAWAGVALGVLMFGIAHRYQGPAGMIATALVGALLTAIYLLTASLWTAIAIHVAIDLNALVLRPVVAGRVRLFRLSRSRSRT